jgi:hypothetical protein
MEMDEVAGGHRVVKHEFPYQIRPFTEDLGMKGKEYSILGYLAGQNYKVNKEKLVEQLEKPNEIAVLKHPYVGTVNVRCIAYRIIEINTEMGFIRVQMQLVDAGIPYEQVKSTSVSILGETIESTLGAVSKFISDSLTAGEDALEEYIDTLNGYTEALEDKMVPFMRIREGFEGLRVTIDQNKDAIGNFLAEPQKLWESIKNLFKTPEKVPAPDIFVSILLSRFPGVPISPLDASRIAYASDAILKTNLENPKKIEEMRDQFLKFTDEFLYSYPPVELYESVQSLKIEMMKHFQKLLNNAKLKSYTPSFGTNSILLAYDLYGDLGNEKLICESNSHLNPAQIRAHELIWVPVYE